MAQAIGGIAVPEVLWANARELEALGIKGGEILRELVAKVGGDLTAQQRLAKAKKAFQRTVKEKLCITAYVPSWNGGSAQGCRG